MMELCEQFFALNPPTRVKLANETLSGTLEALSSGAADLALGVVMTPSARVDFLQAPLGHLKFVFAVAPRHPLAKLPEPLKDNDIRQYRAVAVADSAQRGISMSIGLLVGQDVFTVTDMSAKLEAQIRGIGSGFLPTGLAQPYIDNGQLVVKRVERAEQQLEFRYAWRKAEKSSHGRALQWWLVQLQSPVTRASLLSGRGAAH